MSVVNIECYIALANTGKKKDNLRKFVEKLNVEKETSAVKRIWMGAEQSLDETVL